MQVIQSNFIWDYIVNFYSEFVRTLDFYWQFFNTKLFTIDLSFLNILDFLVGADFNFGTYDVSFGWFITSTGLVIAIVLRIISLIK